MRSQPVTLSLTLSLLLLCATQATAAETHTGFIVAVGAHEITISSETGEMQKFTLADNAMITLDDEPVRLNDLMPQHRVTVVAQREGTKFVASLISAYTNKP